MNATSKILWLRERIRDQQKWIEMNGGDLAGYRARYGDVNYAPLNADGSIRTFTIPTERQTPELIEGLKRIDSVRFVVPMYADGGSKIWEADVMAYDKLVDELLELEKQHPEAARTAGIADPRPVVIKCMKNYDPERDLKYFGSLVHSWDNSPRPSNGEIAASSIAHNLLQNLGKLDESAQRGVVAFVELLMRGEVKRASEILRGK
jgi:hypothetical protein